MSRSADRRHAADDEGFTLIEIVVALGILTIVMVALLPQLVVGIKATGTARLVSQAKGVSQGEQERMRNLPFHIAPTAGHYVDVLDHYYPDLATPGTTPVCKTGAVYTTPATGWAGYVGAGSAARCDYEPASGAFYRVVKVVPAASGITSFTVVVDTQFLSGATPAVPVSPVTGYDTQTIGKDNPAASQIGVTVTVMYRDRGTLRPVTTYTQIAQRLPSLTRVRAEADARVLEVGSMTPDGVQLSLSAGLLDLSGSVSYSSTVNATLAAVTAGLSTGEQASGAATTEAAPPGVTAPAVGAGAGTLSTGGCSYACWGPTSYSGFAASADDALINAGSATGPVQALVSDVASNAGVSFGNTTTPADYRTALALQAPLVRLDPSSTAAPSGLSGCAPGVAGPASYLDASGYLRTTAAGASGVVESCAVARSAAIELFPTSFAPHGVVRIILDRAAVQCLVQGSGHAASTSYDYRAEVKYYDGSGYVTAAVVAPGAGVDPLDAVPLSTPVGGGRTLGDYIASWSSLTAGKITATNVGGVAKATLPGIVTIASQPVRSDAAGTGVDDRSVVSVTVGALGCSSEDAR